MSTILLIEDSAGQRAEVRATIEASGLFDRILEAGDGIEGLRIFLSEAPDLVLCNLEIPGLDGEKLLRMRQAGEGESATPFLVLTAVTDPARRADLLEQGASDTIAKPFHAAELIARVALHLKLVQAQRELIEKNKALEHLSRTDPLTGLANRRHLDEQLEAEFRRSRRYQTPFAVVMADLDHFKAVNDAHGHLVGDRLLAVVAEKIRSMVRETDCAGRFGGEEFLVILGHNDCDGAGIFAERLRQAIEGMCVPLTGGEQLSVTISIGIASWAGDVGSSETLVRRADAALYDAKAAGRNRVCVYSGSEGTTGPPSS
jgi:two-component system cell cycle response regulator